MKWRIIFVVVFACFFNEVYTWSVADVEGIRSEPANEKQALEESNHYSSAIREKCSNNFTSRIHNLVTEVGNKSEMCAKTFGYQTNINKDLRLEIEIDEKVTLIRDLIAKCALKPNIVEYLECEKSIESERQNITTEIILGIEKLYKPFEKNENETDKCLIETSNECKYKCLSAVYDLKLCLQSKYESTLQKPSTNPIEELSPKSEFSEILNKTKVFYEFLKTCVLNDLGFEKCLLETKKKSREILLHEYFYSYIYLYAADHFEELTEIDKAENSCLRQLMATLPLSYGSFFFDLEGCIRYGYAAIIQTDKNEEKDVELIRNLIKYNDAFNVCRIINKDLDTMSCVFRMFGENTPAVAEKLQREISQKSEENFKKLSELINEGFSTDHPCIGDLFLMLQYNGLNMYPKAKTDLWNCLLKGYKSSLPRTEEEMIASFKVIQDYMRNCSLHKESPEFQFCFRNAIQVHDANFGYILDKRDQFGKIIDESDKTNQTCFRKIIQVSEAHAGDGMPELEKCVENYYNILGRME